MKKLCLLTMIMGFGAGVLYAQSPWLSDARVSMVALEWDKPLLDSRTFSRDDVRTASSVLFLTGRLRVNEELRLEAELPVSHFGLKNTNAFVDDRSTTIGNVYVGGIYDVRIPNPDNHVFVELGVRIPTTPSISDDRFANVLGLFSELDRNEAFIEDTWSIPLIGTYITEISGPFAARLRLGTAYDIYAGDLKELDNEFHLLYGISGLYRKPNAEASIGFMGRNQYAGNNPDFIDSGFTQLRAGIARPFGNFVPGVYVRKPLGENYNAFLDWAFGFNVEFRNNQRR